MNRLANEKSPYLLQHKDNPVDWYPWTKEAFQRARDENKPVFLSIGYSTCHWCHVMAHESFNDKEVAELMNRTFINIKVDREERPDLDQIYMEACRMINGNGGWPLNIIMTCDKKPFFAATYIPKNGKTGRYGMIELIGAIETNWSRDSSQFIERGNLIAGELQKAVENKVQKTENEIFDRESFHKAFRLFQNNFDSENGGFGYRPKFPSPHNLLFLLRYHVRNKKNETALAMAEKTLVEMRKGGIFDQIGYGFHRYSTDDRWFLPHFEKMLYDQAMCLMAFSAAWMITGHNLYKVVAEEIIEFVTREMQSAEGGYYSAQDADTDNSEGKFYTWDYKEIQKILDVEELEIFLNLYPVKSAGNFVEEASGHPAGTNILYMENTNRLLEYSSNIEKRGKIKKIHRKLCNIRSLRTAPQKDDKILTNWTGLMTGAMAFTSAALLNPSALGGALKAAAFVSINLLNQNLSFHRCRMKEAAIEANLEDYAFHIFGLLQLYHACADVKLLKTAIELSGKMIDEFYDPEQGGFFFISQQTWKDEGLLVRPRDFFDGALPCGNSVALHDLILLKKYTGSERWNACIEKTIQALNVRIKENPTSHSFSLLAIDLYLYPGVEIVINAGEKNPDAEEAINIIKSIYFPGLIYHSRNKANFKQLAEIAPFTAQMGDPDKLAFYVCENYACRKPIYDLSEFLKIISDLKDF